MSTQDSVVCGICGHVGPTIHCSICQYWFCTTNCMSVSPGAMDKPDFICPDCLGDAERPCFDATRHFRAPSVALLTISLDTFQHSAKWLADAAYGTLLAEGMQVPRLTLDLTPTMQAWSGVEWLASLPSSTSLFVLLVTETIADVGWIWNDPDDDLPHANMEHLVLSQLFSRDTAVANHIARMRQSFLFVVSCGGNYITLDDKPEFKEWIQVSGPFKHLIGFLSPRLAMSELPGFVSQFVHQVAVRGVQPGVALVEAYTRDEQARVNTDIIWFSQYHIIVLRLASRVRPYGIDLPAVRTACRCQSDGIKRWNMGGEYRGAPPMVIIPFKTSCCGMTLRVVLPEGDVDLAKNAGVRFVRGVWPARPKYHFEYDVKPQRAADRPES